jgi:hypothetical protein
MFTTALPVALSAGGRSAVPDPMIVGNARPVPSPDNSQPGRTAAG